MARSMFNRNGGNRTSNREGLSRRELILSVGSTTIRLEFWEGGMDEGGEKYHASAGGGVYASDLATATTITGKFHYQPAVFVKLTELFQRKNPFAFRSATYREYATGNANAVLVSINFSNMVISTRPRLTHANFGEESMMEVSFSCNDANTLTATVIEG